MKIKLAILLEIFSVLGVLAQNKMPVKAGYRIAKNLNLLRPEVETYEKERIKLLESLGTKSEDGTHYDFADGKQAEFQEQIGILLAEEVEIKLGTLTPDELGSANVEPSLLVALEGIVIMESPEQTSDNLGDKKAA